MSLRSIKDISLRRWCRVISAKSQNDQSIPIENNRLPCIFAFVWIQVLNYVFDLVLYFVDDVGHDGYDERMWSTSGDSIAYDLITKVMDGCNLSMG